ncbi:hypothetical protein [Ruegeria arenilitoris]|uniref:hypothetical protein n=1 Tax=Ruegeria arenilitoris TaxID=1173585 RepID=UPI00147D2BE2|nr:hypothetical protein [Ruegeria arenilitoris]
MFCPTTTPFDIQDITPVLSKPLREVETAWEILRPHFGVQLHFGCGRTVAVPNFFDVIAMRVLTEILVAPQSTDKLTQISVRIAEEVAIILDQREFENPFEEKQRAVVLFRLISSFNRGDFQAGVRLDFNEFWVIAIGIIDVFKKVQLAIESSIGTDTRCA